MSVINKRKICSKHGFYNAIENPNGCPLCKKIYNNAYDSCVRSKDRMRIYNSARWKRLRDKVRVRDNFLCQQCLRDGVETIGIECDHIVELADDISNAYDINNVELLCVACHAKKTRAERDKRNFANKQGL